MTSFLFASPTSTANERVSYTVFVFLAFSAAVCFSLWNLLKKILSKICVPVKEVFPSVVFNASQPTSSGYISTPTTTSLHFQHSTMMPAAAFQTQLHPASSMYYTRQDGMKGYN
jgi:hypothetical protein